MYWSSPPRYPTTPGYGSGDYRSTPVAPPNAYYTSTKYNIHTSTPSKDRGHARRASHEPTSYATYATPRPTSSYYNTPGGYGPKDFYYTTSYATPKRTADPVSSTARPKARPQPPQPRAAPAATAGATAGAKNHARPTTRGQPPPFESKSRHEKPVHVSDEDDEGYGSSERSPPPPYNRGAPGANYYYRYPEPEADWYYYSQATPDNHRSSAYYSSAKPRPSTAPRARATSFNTPKKQPSAAAAAAAAARHTPRQATASDSYKHGIPAGYQSKNWDPDEEPILLLGSVFDANSIGKWIYDWTVYRCGAATPLSDMAGEMWLLLIQLAGKIKRAEEALPRIRNVDDRDLVEEFLESGERLWERFSGILRVCENYMWKYMKKEGTAKKSSKTSSTMTSNSGCVFVDVIFGRDRQLESTEKLMTGMRLWSMRFDANCEDIVRRS